MTRKLFLILAVLIPYSLIFASDSPRPLSLAECLKIADQNHPDLIASHALVEAAEAHLRISRSGFLPRLDMGGSYTRQTYNFAAAPGTTPRQVTLFSNGQSSTNAPYYYGGFTLSQTIFDFGRTRAGIIRSEAELEASRQNLERSRQVIHLNVRSAYFGMLAAAELVRIRTQAVQNQSKHLEQARAFHEVGRSPKIDVTKQEVALANAQVDLRQSQADLDVAKAALATAMGLPVDQAPEPVNTLQQVRSREELPKLLAEAERNRPDLKSLREQVAAARADVALVHTSFRPDIVFGSFFDYRNLKFPLIYNWSLGALVAQNLFAGGADRARLSEAKAQARAVDANVSSLLERVRLEVFTAFSDLQVSEDKIGLAFEAEQEAKENLELAEGRYQAGYGNIIELTDAQLLATNSQAQTVTARYDYQVAAGRLDAAVGREDPCLNGQPCR